MACIYALVCPVEGSIRYVGKTSDVLNRYRSHISEAKYRRGRKDVTAQKICKQLGIPPP